MQDVAFSLPELGITSDLIGVAFSNHTVGCSGGATGATGCSGTRYDAGNQGLNDTQVINKLWTSGINVNFAASDPTDLQNLISSNTGQATASYTIAGSGSGSFLLDVAAPEPGTLALLGIGFCLVGCFKKRRGTLKD
jgi:hypothetical protein